MTATSEVFKALPEVFETALLLTGSTEAGEAVVSDGIGSIEFGNIVREACCLAERTRIAQELHDTLLQGFFALSLQFHDNVDQLPADLVAKPRFVALAELMARVLEEGRFAVRGLRSPHAHLRSLGQAFAAVPTELGLDAAVGFRVTVDGRPNELRPVVRDEVYRIGREAIVNAYRHSRAKNIEMLIEFRPDQLRIAVRDDGCGIDPRQLKGGQNECWSLQGMRERASQIGGRVRVFTRIELGTEVEVCVHGQLAYEQFGHLSGKCDHA